jgi:hypothetical protein
VPSIKKRETGQYTVVVSKVDPEAGCDTWENTRAREYVSTKELMSYKIKKMRLRVYSLFVSPKSICHNPESIVEGGNHLTPGWGPQSTGPSSQYGRYSQPMAFKAAFIPPWTS